MTTNSQKTKVSSNFPNLDAILKSPVVKNNFFLFLRILKFVDTRKFYVSLPFFAYMLNFQVSLQKREMFVWKGKDMQISLARFTSLPISLQQVNISGILRASARSGNSEVVSLNSALVSESDISSSVPSILSYFQYGKEGFFLFVISIIYCNSVSSIMSFKKKQVKLAELTFCFTFRREKNVSLPVVTN